ncbi:hypothetical protein RsTz2092_07870 [Deferribacterales bacterium RsTz2092]|nr:hypothetical protein AGMMS49941_05180 [Deferribacterales bacterium]
MEGVLLAMLFFTFNVNSHDYDQYLSGATTTVIKGEFNPDGYSVVRDGKLFLPLELETDQHNEEVLADLTKIQGIDADRIAYVPNEELSRLNAMWTSPRKPLFDPLIADPKYPKVHAGYHWYTYEETEYFHNGVQADIGGTYSLLKVTRWRPAYLDAGLQVRVSAVFDMDTISDDLINSDFMAGFYTGFSFSSWSLLFRGFHESTHLGDEYVLNNNIPEDERINVSYEMLEAIVSIDSLGMFRPYFGGGWYVYGLHVPGALGHWQYHAGFEVKTQKKFTSSPNFLVALDVKGSNPSDYAPSGSLMLGVETFDNVWLTLEGYTGYHYAGQFFSNKATYVGVGFHLY